MVAAGKRRKGFLWTEKEDKILKEYISVYGEGKWNRISKLTGLKRSGKSCRLRWMNYLTPNVKKDGFSQQEEDLIIRLHKLLGNRWSLIAGRIPGRTDNQVKNHWNSRLSKKHGRMQKATKISCISLSNELQCTKGKEISSTLLNHCPTNPSSNLPIYDENGENYGLLMPGEGWSSYGNTEFGTSSTIQETDQMMSEYSNLNSYNNLSPMDGCLWDELWLY